MEFMHECVNDMALKGPYNRSGLSR